MNHIENIVEIEPGRLVPYTNNPRDNENAVGAVAQSIHKYGFKQPIVVDRNLCVIAGHTRLKAAKILGLEKVPCVIADDLTDAQVKAYRIADNKTGEFSEWDEEALRQELEELAEDGVDLEQEFAVTFGRGGLSFIDDVPEEPDVQDSEIISLDAETKGNEKVICPRCGYAVVTGEEEDDYDY